jgi:hypothetical protein
MTASDRPPVISVMLAVPDAARPPATRGNLAAAVVLPYRTKEGLRCAA